MEIAILMGRNGDRLKNSMVQYKSDLQIEAYDNINDFIDKSYKLTRFYDRVLILSSQVHNETDLTSLKQFREQFCPDTSMVIMCQKGHDETLAKVVDKTFASQQVTSVLFTSTTMSNIVECAVLEIGALKNKYGIVENLDNLIEDDEVDLGFEGSNMVAPEPEKAKGIEKDKGTAPQTKNSKSTSKATSKSKGKKSSGGFFSKLFGGNKEKIQPSKSTPKPTNKVVDKAVDAVQSFADDLNGQGSLDNIDTSGVNTSFDSEFTFEPEVPQSAPTQPSIQTPEPSNNEGTPSEEKAESQFFDTNSDTSEIEQNSSSDDAYEDDKDDTLFEDSAIEPDMQGTKNDGISEEPEATSESSWNENATQNSDLPVNNDVSENEMSFTPTEPQNSEFKYQDVSMDFGSMPMPSVSDVSENDNDIDENLGNIGGIAQAENEYRQETEKPKVVTKVVTREIVRDTGKHALTALKNVKAGLTHRAIVVTGDRGSGVTTTALVIVRELVKQGIKVLYVDLDNENHGVLNYIDVKILYDYGDSVIKGTKLLNKSELLHNAVVKYDDGIDIITSDFSTDVSSEELVSTVDAITGAMDSYGVVVVDCPIKNLHLVSDMMLLGNTVLCAEGTKRGVMNMLCQCELSALPVKYKKKMVAYGLMFLEHTPKNTDVKKLLGYFRSVYTPSDNGADWVKMKPVVFNGKLSDEILNTLLEG